MARRDVHDLEQWRAAARQAGYHAAQMARVLRIPLRTLNRYLHQVSGQSAQEWCNELRLRDAPDLLKEERSVKIAASRLHFKQASHFSREFKRFYKLSPTEYLDQSDRGRR